MKQQILALGLGISIILLASAGLHAQSGQGGNCAKHASVIAQLAEKYGESRQSIGLAASGQVVEVFASLETGSWTIIVTGTSGTACMVAAGENFERVDEALTPAMLGDPA